jgi:hypothetical protein
MGFDGNLRAAAAFSNALTETEADISCRVVPHCSLLLDIFAVFGIV